MSSLLPPPDFPQVDHPWLDVPEAGSLAAYCQICAEQGDTEQQGDRAAHIIADLRQVEAQEVRRVAAENLRLHGGVAGPGLRSMPPDFESRPLGA